MAHDARTRTGASNLAAKEEEEEGEAVVVRGGRWEKKIVDGIYSRGKGRRRERGSGWGGRCGMHKGITKKVLLRISPGVRMCIRWCIKKMPLFALIIESI